jgi:hypothetical protein
VPGAELKVLTHEDLAWKQRLNGIGAMAGHDHHVITAGIAGGSQNVRHQRKTQHPVRHLRQGGRHASTFASR